MIVDTSVLMAIALVEPDWERLLRALGAPAAVLPAPVLTECQLVSAGRGPVVAESASRLMDRLLATDIEVAPFDQRHAAITAVAREVHGKGNGTGGKLNFGDLMVYAVAKQRGEPILCTGREFASTDIDIHPASRLDP